MAKDPKQVNPDLVKQEIEKGRIGDRGLAQKPGVTPDTGFSEEESEDIVWDDDQRQLIENQDMNEIERARRSRPAR
jgi:hypothetical protein